MQRNKFFLTFLLSLFLALPIALQAASTLVSVKAGREIVNAVEGILVLPPSVKVEQISLGGSAVLFWIKTPEWDEVDHTISFAGLSPGGFSGTKPLFTLETSSGSIVQTGGRLMGYRNDGNGTELMLEYSFSQATSQIDLDKPEIFTPIISSSPDIFDGKTFVSFATQDKGRGIKGYEYADTWIFNPNDDDWQEAQSPLLLSDTMLFKKIYIRALDSSDNARVVSISAPYRYATILFGIIIILCALLFLRRSFHSHSFSS